jgi:hypothetical protein
MSVLARTKNFVRLAAFKAHILNDFIVDNDVRSLIEFGCRDGNQLRLCRYPQYIGIDVSPTAVAKCRKLATRATRTLRLRSLIVAIADSRDGLSRTGQIGPW